MSVVLSYPPQNVVLQTGNKHVLITWDIVPGATGYIVQRSTNGVTFSTINSPSLNYYIDSSAVIGTNYFYQVASVNTSGTSSYSASYPLSITPCAPGQINLGYLRYMSKLRADKLNSEFLTMDEWNFNINQSTFELYDILVSKYGDKYFLADPLVFNTTNAQSYPLPDGVNYGGAPALYKLAGVDCGINASNNQWFTLPKFNWIDRNRYATLQLAGTVTSIYGLAYCDNGNKLYFIPQPQNAQIIQLWYVPMMPQLLLDTDMLPFSISGWSEYVMVDAAIKALNKEESFEQVAALNAQKAALLERISTIAANRDVGQPNTVSNTRARAGDQNFGSNSGWGGGGYTGWNGY